MDNGHSKLRQSQDQQDHTIFENACAAKNGKSDIFVYGTLLFQLFLFLQYCCTVFFIFVAMTDV